MKFINDTVTDINIAYIGGGSRGWAWTLMVDLAVEPQLSGNINLYDINFEAAYSNEIIGNRLSQRDDVPGKWRYKAANKIEEALSGADFVVISILPGTFNEMASDVHLPEKYGIYQSVGDTTGPGGLIRMLRTIPMYVEIAENIQKFCPNAWVINYTNPMSSCVRTLYEIFPEIKAFGCCHEVFSVQELMAAMLFDMKGIEGVKRNEIKVNILGINHFTWLDEAHYKGINLIPIFKEFSDKYFEKGFINEGEVDEYGKYFQCSNKVKFDLFRHYNMIAVGGDRHLAEFMPPWYLKNPKTVETWGFRLTPVEWRINNAEKLQEKSRKLISGDNQIELFPSGEEGVLQIKSLLGLGDFVTNVNIPNRGQMGSIPLNIIVETNAIFSRDSILPIMAGSLPHDVNALVLRHVLNHETILKASLTRDKKLAFNAFINDPLVSISYEDAEKLFSEMLNNTKEYLYGWNI